MAIRIEPDYIYDPDEWDITYDYADKSIFEEEMGDRLYGGDKGDPPIGDDIKKYKTLVQGPDRFLASIVMSYDEDDQPNEVVYKWFDTEKEAIKAIMGPTSNVIGE